MLSQIIVQGQTIPYALIDIACPLTGDLMPFNMNVALSRARRKDNIRLLRNFDAKPLTTHPNEHLRNENERLRLVRIDSEKELIGASHQIQECLVSQ